MWDWKTLGTAILVSIAQLFTGVAVIAGVLILLGIVGAILYGIWLGIVWLYFNISLIGFIWFCGTVIVLLIIGSGIKNSYKHVQQTSHLTFWEKVWGENRKKK